MTEDFYDNMKKEQEILDHSYRESVRQKNERNAEFEGRRYIEVKNLHQGEEGQ